jgi:hypothetical protein
MTTRRARRSAPADVFAPMETLEGRALLSAAVAPPIDPSQATPLNGGAVVADAGFLNPDAGSNAGSQSGGTDGDMYDFGGAWGSRATSRSGGTVDFSDAFDDGRVAPTRRTPADVSATGLRPDQAVSQLRDATDDADGPADTTVANGGGPVTISTPRPYTPEAASAASTSVGVEGAKAKTATTGATVPGGEVIKIRRSFLR